MRGSLRLSLSEVVALGVALEAQELALLDVPEALSPDDEATRVRLLEATRQVLRKLPGCPTRLLPHGARMRPN